MPSTADITAFFDGAEEGAFYNLRDFATLRQLSGGTTAVVLGDPVGYAEDLSGNGNNAIQATAADRPIAARVPEGGRTNLHTNTVFGAGWDLNEFQIVETTGEPDPFGGSTAVNVTSTSNNFASFQLPVSGLTIGEDYASSVYVNVTGDARVVVRNQGFLRFNGIIIVEFTAGVPTSVPGFQETVTDVGGGWYRITKVEEATATSGTLQIRPNQGSTGAIDVTLAAPQLELGTAPTAYQQVESAWDITSDGIDDVQYPLDVSSDSLTVTMPDLGSSATRALVNQDLTVTYLESQTIGAGALDIPLDSPAILYIDRALTAGEKTDFESWALSPSVGSSFNPALAIKVNHLL